MTRSPDSPILLYFLGNTHSTIGALRLRRFLLVLALCAAVLASIGWFAETQKPLSKQQLMRANNLGVAYLNQQKLEQALKEFEQAVTADKNNAIAQLNLGIALLNLARATQAEEA